MGKLAVALGVEFNIAGYAVPGIATEDINDLVRICG